MTVHSIPVSVPPGSAPSDAALRTVAIGLPWLPGQAHSSIRQPTSGFFQRFLDRIAHRAPAEASQTYVRGAAVSADCLIEAIAKASVAGRFLLLTSPLRREATARWISTNPTILSGRPAQVISSQDIVEGALKTHAPDLWFDVAADITAVARLRERFSARVYPIASVQHGFSIHLLLWERFTRLLMTRTYPCDSIICTSRQSQIATQRLLSNLVEDFERDFEAHLAFGLRTDVIPLCVDTDAFVPADKAPLRKKLGLPKDAIIVLYVGYLSALKADLIPLLSVFGNLVAERPNASPVLVLAGTGPSQETFDRLAAAGRAFGIQNSLIVKQGITDDCKRALIAASDIFVSPADNLQESFGLTPVEAMSCGVPQVASDWDGYRDTVVDGETGFLIPTCWGDCSSEYEGTGDMLGWPYDHISVGQSVGVDLRVMSARLKDLISNPGLRAAMGEKSRARAVQRFSYAAVAKQYGELFQELVSIADGAPQPDTPRRFDQPAYFKIYKHYATKVLHGSDRVTIDNDAPKNILSVLRPLLGEIDRFQLLNHSLLDNLVAYVRVHGAGERGVDIGTLSEVAARSGHQPGEVLRHTLWLLKYGLLREA